MQQQVDGDNRFVIDLLTTLQQERFSPLAWWHFLIRSWHMAWKTACNNPSLKASWMRITILMGILVIGVCIITGLLEGPLVLLRLLPGFLFCVTYQQYDLFWHLGLNRRTRTGEMLPVLGIANMLTGLRGLGASLLLGRILGGLFTPVEFALLIFVFGVVTDILDGVVARRTKTQSKLGQIIDGEADFCLYLALSIILVRDSVLPLWLGIVLVLRFFVPLIAALSSYFFFAQPVRFGSTIWGKCAGVAQCLYFFVLLAPTQLSSLTHLINLPLLVVTLALTITAPLAQIRANMHLAPMEEKQ